jgi:recombinational DNA repair protein RecR
MLLFYIEVIQLALMCHYKEKNIYILLTIFNSDDVVMLHKNQNFHLHFFVKSGALQYNILSGYP